MKQYKIHPSIGIARMGNSRTECFIGPEAPDPDFVPAPDGRYRDADNAIRRQAQRFRIYEYESTGVPGNAPVPVREITGAEAEIRWNVHLANTKGFTEPTGSPRQEVPNDPGPKSIEGASQTVEVAGNIFGVEVALGTLRTDEEGRLLVLGGFGESASPSNAPLTGLHSADWYDDASDGPVKATIRFRDGGAEFIATPAWVVCGVPAYAAPIYNIVTLYDLARDLAIRFKDLPTQPAVRFTRDIYPVLRRAVFMQWVSPSANHPHGHGAGNFLEPGLFALLGDNSPASLLARERVFGKLRGAGGNMPPLNSGLRLTPTKLEQFRKWSEGMFVADWQGEPPAPRLEDLPVAEQPEALDRAAMESMVGGSFAPGIETGSLMADASTYERPFRIDSELRPGALTDTLSIPWQSDFRACTELWWPGARPNSVTANGTTFHDWVPTGINMVTQWSELGFITKRDEAYVEEERLLPIPGV